MSQTHHHQAFVELMRALFEVQRSAWSIERSDSQEERVCVLQTLVWTSGWRYLERFDEFDWKEEVRFEEHKCVLLLPPLERDGGLIPILSIEYAPNDDFSKSCLVMRVLLLKGQVAEGREKLQGFGFRIESPSAYCQVRNDEGEGDAEMGRHDFYHAQLIVHIGNGLELDLPDWWPCCQPSFPLRADGPGDAVLNLILTLYGACFYREFLTAHAGRFARGCMSDPFRRFSQQVLETR